MTPASYLADTSALARILAKPAEYEHWNQAMVHGVVAVCPLTELELLFSARSQPHRAELATLFNRLLLPIDLDDRDYRRAWQIQELLTSQGEHRSAGPVDLVVAACAELRGLTLVHCDGDFETIARLTGQGTHRVSG
ncbi:PIN domain nuclease [Nocardiopsis sp. CNT312]|uniref:PIN domain nuclease n=1 Tax=Nocardiopsis sp. CNT312 TaxID=1137268 RepID=UPI000491B1AF|nr:PIN domain nuclease [Nocardiopsis sp. CNT312]